MRIHTSFIYSSLCAVTIASGIAAVAVASTEKVDPVVVTIKNFEFAPALVHVKPGQSIVWINTDEEPHTVAANDKSYRSPTMDQGEKYSKTFTAGGEFVYFCTFHPHMTGKIIVDPS